MSVRQLPSDRSAMRQRMTVRVRDWSKRGQRRTAAAVVELAIVLPILLSVSFGTLEICNRLFLRQTAAIAAYEGARLGARRTVTEAQVRARCLNILEGRRVVGGTVTIVTGQGGLAALATGSQLTVQVRIPISGNTPVSYVLTPTGNVQASSVMLRE